MTWRMVSYCFNHISMLPIHQFCFWILMDIHHDFPFFTMLCHYFPWFPHVIHLSRRKAESRRLRRQAFEPLLPQLGAARTAEAFRALCASLAVSPRLSREMEGKSWWTGGQGSIFMVTPWCGCLTKNQNMFLFSDYDVFTQEELLFSDSVIYFFCTSWFWGSHSRF